jgi:hypothetical protein
MINSIYNNDIVTSTMSEQDSLLDNNIYSHNVKVSKILIKIYFVLVITFVL